MKNNKLIAFVPGVIFLVVISYALGVGLFKKTSLSTSENKKLQVVTSFYPLYFFASQIGGNKAEITNITPAGAEPHDYEPSTQDIAQIDKSDILVLNGRQLEAWGDKVRDDLQGKKVSVVIAGEGLINQQVIEERKKIVDPHVWLDPELAKKGVTRIAEAFEKVDASNKSYYQSNASQLEEKLDLLDQEFKQGLLSCQQKNIVTSHAAFGYIATRYNLKQVPISGLSPDEEPSPQQLAQVTAFARANNVKYIFFETFVSPRLSETVAREIGAKTLVLNPLEGLTKEEERAGKDYFSIQKENLENLRIALECK